MKTNPIQNDLLLAETNELGWWRRRRLRRVLRRDATLRAEQMDWQRIKDLYHSLPQDDHQPSDFALHRIREAAKMELDRRYPRENSASRARASWRPAIAYAMVALVFVAYGLSLLRKSAIEQHAAIIQQAPGPSPIWDETYLEIEQSYLDLIDAVALGTLQRNTDDDPDLLALQFLLWEDS